MIRTATTEDAAQVCAIYNHYVAHTHVTFEEQPVAADTMAQRIRGILPRLPWLVWAESGEVLGYSYAGTWKERSAYRYSVESTIYLRPDATGRRIGSRLYEALIAELRARRIHAVIGGISLPNAASVALHEKLGFEGIGEFREVGWKFGRWIGVGYWQLLL
jgi:L-amino acid N-acyltransferase YncA